MSPKVALSKRPNFLKARLLAPFSPRYREKLHLQGVPEPLQIVAPHTVVTRDGKLAFVKNSKAGCTTVAQVLYSYDFGATFDGVIHKAARDQISGHLHVRAALAALRDPSVYKFTLVRHPVSRCVSAFQDFVLDQKNPGTRHHIGLLPAFGYRPDAPDAKKFDAFLAYITQSFAVDRTYTDPHFRLQTINVALGHVAYDRIGKLENYAADLTAALHEAGIWQDRLAEVLSLKTNQSRARKFTPTPEQERAIRTLYAEDFAAFDYQ